MSCREVIRGTHSASSDRPLEITPTLRMKIYRLLKIPVDGGARPPISGWPDETYGQYKIYLAENT